MFCSTIIPTIGRSTLSRAVLSVLDQDIPGEAFEVIVVNDSGEPLEDAGWRRDERVQVIDTCRRERSVARNTGAAIAQGRYLHFLDDDDWLLPGAFKHLHASASTVDAAWVYGCSQLVDREGRYLIQLHHEISGNCFVQVMAGEWIPLQSSLIKAQAFFEVGGFNPLITGPEDVDLCRRIALHSDLCVIGHVVACIGMGVENSSTDFSKAVLYSRWAREAIISEPGSFARMLASANSDYWKGRVVRVYFTSVLWNITHRFMLTATSRAMFGLLALLLSPPCLISGDFWQAIAKPYSSITFRRGLQETNG